MAKKSKSPPKSKPKPKRRKKKMMTSAAPKDKDEIKKLDEPKKDELKKDEPKKDEPKKLETKEEEPKVELKPEQKKTHEITVSKQANVGDFNFEFALTDLEAKVLMTALPNIYIEQGPTDKKKKLWIERLSPVHSKPGLYHAMLIEKLVAAIPPETKLNIHNDRPSK